MPKPQHAKVTFSGVFKDAGDVAVEIWSFGYSVATIGEEIPDEAVLQAIADASATAYNTAFRPLMEANIQRTRVRYSLHAEGGLVKRRADGSYAQADNEAVSVGTGTAAAKKPLSSAVCVTLDTPRPGPTGRGRFFLPQTTGALGSDWRFAIGHAEAIRDAVIGYFTATDTSVGPPSVVSSYGYATAVNTIRVGTVPDTMRSRRNALLEAYVSGAL